MGAKFEFFSKNGTIFFWCSTNILTVFAQFELPRVVLTHNQIVNDKKKRDNWRRFFKNSFFLSIKNCLKFTIYLQKNIQK